MFRTVTPSLANSREARQPRQIMRLDRDLDRWSDGPIRQPVWILAITLRMLRSRNRIPAPAAMCQTRPAASRSRSPRTQPSGQRLPSASTSV